MRRKFNLVAGALALTTMLVGCGQAAETATTSDSTTGTAAVAEQGAGADAASYEVATVRWADWGEDYHTGFPESE